MEFRFAHPVVLLLLLGLVGALAAKFYLLKRQTDPALRYSDNRLVSGLPSGWRVRMRSMPDVLRLVVWVLLVIALARPQSGRAREVIRGEGIDIVLALDISGSMAALDFAPLNRLETAKQVIGEFIAGREFDRIGLVVFARNAFHQSPLTLDYTVLLDLLEDVRLVTDIRDTDGRALLLDGTAVGLGIASAGVMMKDSTALSRVVVLLTDGDNNAALDPITAAQVVATLGIRVYVIGMGKNGVVPVPDLNGEVQYVESSLNEETLQQIAETGNGLYFRAEDIEGLRSIYDEIDRLERSRIERQVFVAWQDQAWGFLGISFILLMLERLLRRTVFQSLP